MLLSLHPNWWEDWSLYHKVTFDGVNKKIIVNEGESFLRVKEDVYSSWKEWVKLRDNAKFLPAFRSVGGDPLGNNLYAGDIYFLINEWQIIVYQNVEFQGVIYQDDSLLPFIIVPGAGVRSTVSNLVQTSAPIINVTSEDIPEIGTIQTDIENIKAELLLIKTGVAELPTETEIKDSVWNAIMANYTTPGTFGYFIQKKLLTVAKFIGLK
jgi:hypothetical protein